MAAGGLKEMRLDLRRRLHELEMEFGQVQARLTELGPGESLPGLYLVVEAAGSAALLPAMMVREIVRLVEIMPLPQVPPHVLGTFLYRGEPVVVADLACYLGSTREPRLDAHVVVLHTVRPMAVVVDRVRALVEEPVLSDSEQGSTRFGSKIMVALCRVGDELVPLLRVHPLLEGVSR